MTSCSRPPIAAETARARCPRRAAGMTEALCDGYTARFLRCLVRRPTATPRPCPAGHDVEGGRDREGTEAPFRKATDHGSTFGSTGPRRCAVGSGDVDALRRLGGVPPGRVDEPLDRPRTARTGVQLSDDAGVVAYGWGDPSSRSGVTSDHRVAVSIERHHSDSCQAHAHPARCPRVTYEGHWMVRCDHLGAASWSRRPATAARRARASRASWRSRRIPGAGRWRRRGCGRCRGRRT